jgi:hypothetical protein
MIRSPRLTGALLSCAALFLLVLPSEGAPPQIELFAASQSSVPSGSSVSLEWLVTGADALSLDGVDVSSITTLAVSPLISTTYTLTASNADGEATSSLDVTVLNAPRVVGAQARFVEVIKNDPDNTRMHLSEIEVFRIGVSPDEKDSDGTSRNDLVQAGNPSTVSTRTTVLLDHGDPASVFDGDLERSSGVWSTSQVAGTTASYMLDLGSSEPIGFVRLFGREDACCLERLENISVRLYGDNEGTPGELISSATFLGTAPPGESGHIELDLSLPDPGIRSFTSNRSLIAPGAPVTLSWEVNSSITAVTIDQSIGDVTNRTVGEAGEITLERGPDTTTVYTLNAEWPGGTSQASLAVEVSDLPLIYDFTSNQSLVAPESLVSLSWNVLNATTLTLNGIDVTGKQGIDLSPDRTADYTLIASNAHGTESRSIRIAVVAPGEPLITEFLADNESTRRDEDNEYSDWIEIYNPSGEPASLNDYYLTDDPGDLQKWRFPDVTIAPSGGYLLVFASGKNRRLANSELHTSFSLDRDGEYLALVKPDGTTVLNEFAPYPAQRPDISYGFDARSLREGYFTTASPGSANRTGFAGFVADTTFSIDRGFFDNPIDVSITSATEGASIRYTTDGSRPTARTGLVYTGPIPLETTTVLRAAAFKAGLVPTNVDTQTYIFPAAVLAQRNMNTNVTQHPVHGPLMNEALTAVPSISLVFPGDIDRVEKQASVEFINFEAGSTQMDIGMERYGNYHTDFSKRSIRMNFRSEYGPAKLRFPVFDGHEYESIPPANQFNSIDLRSGNHDMQARGAYMSNRFTDDTMLDMGNIAPHGRFVHVYLNGQYWGQYHLRERWNASMFSEYFGGEKEDYEAVNANNTGGDFLSGVVYDGTGRYWNQARSLVNRPNTFAAIRRYIDIPNLIDFMIVWSSGSSESEFRSAGAVPLGVPFKFFIKDADGWLRGAGSGRETHQGPLGLMTRLRVENDPDYKILLADRIHKHFFNNGALTPGAAISRLQERVDEIEVSFLAESARWNMQSPTSWRSYQTNLMRNTLRRLSRDMVAKYRNAGLYPDTPAPTFAPHGGALPGGTVRLTAPGEIYYTIDGTDPRAPGGAVSDTALLHDGSLILNTVTNLRARTRSNGQWSALNEALFVPEQNYRNLVVSELMYNPGPASASEIAAGFEDSEDFEFLELLNTGQTTVSLEGLHFAEGIEFDFNSGSVTSLGPGEHLLLVEDRAAFEFRYGTGRPVTGQYTGQLRDEGETLQLLSPLGEPILHFTYDNRSPWPIRAAGRGSSLVLVDPSSLPDHGRASSWQAGAMGGTPGIQNEQPLSYQVWATRQGITDSASDPDADGWNNFLEFNLLGDPFQAAPMSQSIRVEVQSLDLGAGPEDYLTLTLRHRVTDSEILLVPELSQDLLNWDTAPGAVLHGRTFHSDNSATSIYRSPDPLTNNPEGYLRIRFERP